MDVVIVLVVAVDDERVSCLKLRKVASGITPYQI